MSVGNTLREYGREIREGADGGSRLARTLAGNGGGVLGVALTTDGLGGEKDMTAEMIGTRGWETQTMMQQRELHT